MVVMIVGHSCLFCSTLNAVNCPIEDASPGATGYWWYWLIVQTLWLAPGVVSIMIFAILTLGDHSTKACVQALCIGLVSSIAANVGSGLCAHPYLMVAERSLDHSSPRLPP